MASKGMILKAVILLLLITACSGLSFGQGPAERAGSQTPGEIPYCDANSSVLCIVSFSVDKKNQMIINFYKPNPSIPNFYLKVRCLDTESIYQCQTVEDNPKLIYCAGEQAPLGAQINIEVYSKNDDSLLARGVFAITAFALPTLVIVTLPSETGTQTIEPPAELEPTPTSRVTNTPRGTKTPVGPTKTATATDINSYPNSYPNP